MHPRQSVEAIQQARRLWSDETTVGTVAAVVLLLLFVGWPLYRARRAVSGGNR